MKMFSDTMSGARDDRPGLAALMEYIREGDTVVVWKLDRLGRNTLNILETVKALTDRGSQYASEHYQRLLAKHGITCSMSRRGDCWDNAPMESFFASLKKELVHGADFATRAQARAAVVEYIEVFYNTQRRHSSLGYVSPAEYEKAE